MTKLSSPLALTLVLAGSASSAASVTGVWYAPLPGLTLKLATGGRATFGVSGQGSTPLTWKQQGSSLQLTGPDGTPVQVELDSRNNELRFPYDPSSGLTMTFRRTFRFTQAELQAMGVDRVLEAQRSAQQRAVQAYSTQLYKIGSAIVADDPRVNLAQLARVLDARCLKGFSSLRVNTNSYAYRATPPQGAGITACSVHTRGKKDLTVKVVGPQGYTSVNGGF